MTGRVTGAKTRLEHAAAFFLVSVQFGLPQLDLVFQIEYFSLTSDMFVAILTGLIAFRQRQNNCGVLEHRMPVIGGSMEK